MNQDRIEIILPHGLGATDEQDAVRIFESAFAFAGVPVADSELRTILDSQEPPLNFAIQFLSGAFAQGVEASLVAAVLLTGAKQTAQAVAAAYESIAKRFPHRSIQISLRVGRGEEPMPSYPLSSDLTEAEKQIGAVIRDLDRAERPRGMRIWHDEVWMSPDEYFAARRAERESEGKS